MKFEALAPGLLERRRARRCPGTHHLASVQTLSALGMSLIERDPKWLDVPWVEYREKEGQRITPFESWQNAGGQAAPAAMQFMHGSHADDGVVRTVAEE